MKKFMLICAPFTSRSGYGDHARDLFHSFYNSNKFDIKLFDVRWGDCPRNALDPFNQKDKKIIDCILPTPTVDRQPDVYVDIRIPNEFQNFGKYNIGITAGIETNAVSQKWMEGCNKMDLIIVPSEHSKSGFVESVYDKIQTLPDGQQQKIGEVKLEKPIEVLFEGVDLDNYKILKGNDFKFEISKKINEDITEDFAFLHVGQWGKGGFGEDRKDIGRMLKIFYESFANKKKQPALILKTNGASFSIIDKDECINKIKQIKNLFPKDWNLPNVYLLHGDFSVDEMNELYNHPKIKSMVSLTHGEGFGRPLLEATMVGLPVIASNWSGQVDFLDTENSLLLPGSLKQVPKSVVWKDIIIEESKWFVADETNVYKTLNYCFEEYKNVKNKANKLMKINREKFSLDKMTDKLVEILDKYLGSLPTEVGLKLPKLKKVTKDEKPKIKLPKLKKV
jgi:glycosyltransferase involved in cell wall biosynthesis